MQTAEFDRLLKKYLAREAAPEEIVRLHELYNEQLEGEVIWESERPDEESLVRTRIEKGVWDKIQRLERGRPKSYRLLYTLSSVAAVLILVFTFWGKDYFSEKNETYISHETLQRDVNRFVMLQDSSLVVLRPGSTLTYVTDFSKDNGREVRVTGEAYFDIRHDEDRPFVVYADSVRTVVLGTAFTVRNTDQGVAVTVKRGKVRVESPKQAPQELIMNQQIQISKKKAEVDPKPVLTEDAGQAMQWVAQDMRFDGMPFGEIVQKLERRYNVVIEFENKELMNCLVSGRFDGTEPLDTVLEILCATRNASYVPVERDRFVINGNGC